MLTSTFIHTQGIGHKTERAIWQSGLTTWDDFLAGHVACPLSQRQRELLVPTVEESVTRFAADDYSYFAKALPSGEQWRAYDVYGSRAAYIDIETLGMGSDDVITVIGLYNGKETKSFVKGFNLEAFADEISKYALILTYSGASFDLPHIRRAFPGLHLDQMHIDLCPTLRKIGLRGGLKHIEDAVGLKRPAEVEGMSGWDAVRLWNEWEWGSRESLDLLLAYNACDVINLKPLAEQAYASLRAMAFDFQSGDGQS
jgi:uncharacterized protein